MTPSEPALREAEEETALDPGAVEVVGELDPLATFSSQSLIVPVVGRLAGRPELTAHEAEVEAILHVPLSELLYEDAYRAGRSALPAWHSIANFFEALLDSIRGARHAAPSSMLIVTRDDERRPESWLPPGFP